MAIALVDIYNNVYCKLGVRPVTATTDINAQNTALNTRFTFILNSLIAEYPYIFAKVRTTLTSSNLSTTPAHGYDYKYTLPTGCLMVLPPEDTDIKFSVEGGYLLTDETSFDLIYLKVPTGYDGYDAIFMEALISYIASEICITLTESITLKQLLDKQAKELLAKAQKLSTGQMIDDDKKINITSTWISCR